MTWTLLFFLLWMAFRMLLSFGRVDSVEKHPPMNYAKPASGSSLMHLTGGDDSRPSH